MIEVRGLTFAYTGQPLLFKDLNWSVSRGEAWAILGPSGCGKSTLLTLIAGLIAPVGGKIQIDRELVIRPRPSTGLILQDYGLLPWATVYENITLGLRIRRFYGPDGQHAPQRLTPTDIDPQIDYWVNRLGLTAVINKYPSQLSGGQRQRTAIARTLILKPDLLLMDEPFASLDAPTREGLQELTLTLQAEWNLTVLLVTHSIEEAAFMGQKVMLLGDNLTVAPQMIDNPHPIAPEYRHSHAYQETCTLLRLTLESQ